MVQLWGSKGVIGVWGKEKRVCVCVTQAMALLHEGGAVEVACNLLDPHTITPQHVQVNCLVCTVCTSGIPIAESVPCLVPWFCELVASAVLPSAVNLVHVVLCVPCCIAVLR